MLSVDVVALRYHADRGLSIGLNLRANEPHWGELALPGVLMFQDETVLEAATRALDIKLRVTLHETDYLIVNQVHDTPKRDVRGPTVAISCIAIIHQRGHFFHWPCTWLALNADALPELPFDHNAIIASALLKLRELVWADRYALEALLGAEFSTGQMTRLVDAVYGEKQRRSTIHRLLTRTPFLERIEPSSIRVSGQPGRPQAWWRFTP
jgi:8-oxo-dGTP diphosphatase